MFVKAILVATIAATVPPMAVAPQAIPSDPGYATFDVDRACDKALDTCLVPRGFLGQVLQANIEMDATIRQAIPAFEAARLELAARREANERLRKENVDLKAMKGCAKVEVTEPPRKWKKL